MFLFACAGTYENMCMCVCVFVCVRVCVFICMSVDACVRASTSISASRFKRSPNHRRSICRVSASPCYLHALFANVFVVFVCCLQVKVLKRVHQHARTVDWGDR